MPSSPVAAGTITLVLGGTRSGKSRTARRLAEASDRQVVFAATADPDDPDMRRRIQRHREDRPADWTTLEPVQQLDAVARRYADRNHHLVLCDEISLTVARWVHDEGLDEDEGLDRVRPWVETVRSGSTPWVVVSALVGRGVVPVEPTARRFRDVLGRVNRYLADRADRVLEVVAGQSRALKGESLS